MQIYLLTQQTDNLRTIFCLKVFPNALQNDVFHFTDTSDDGDPKATILFQNWKQIFLEISICFKQEYVEWANW